MKYKTSTIEVCPDCYYAVAYGTGEMHDLTPERKAAIDEGIRTWWHQDSTSLHAEDDDEPSFTSTPCEVCNMTLGHMAYKVTTFTPTV